MRSGPMWLGILLGLAAGVAVWWAARRLAGSRPHLAARDPEEEGTAAGPENGLFPQALLVVAGMASWGGYSGGRSGSAAQVVPAVAVTGLLLLISLVDWRSRRIPNALVFALLAWAPLQMAWLGWPSPAAGVAGLLAGGGLFLFLALLGRGAMGAGDVKLAAALGAVLGLPLILPALLLGALGGGAAALLLLVTGRAGRKDPMAYGPYLALGAWLVWTRAAGLWP